MGIEIIEIKEVLVSTRFRLSVLLAVAALLMTSITALAGGWAVITLDDLPTNVVAGEPLTIGFVVRQHGITPMGGLDPIVTATLRNTEHFVVYAEPHDQTGHYTATLTFPKSGDWNWSIQAFTMDQPMPVLTVSDSTSLAGQPSQLASKTTLISPLLLLRVLIFGVGVAGLILALQRKSRVGGVLAGLCLVLGVSTFMIGVATSKVEAQGNASVEASSQAEKGRQLFLAKGCITCHFNERAAKRDQYWTIEMGAPDISNYSAHHDVLFIRLKDPVAAKSDTKMPNLELKETEIEALIAFINSK